MNVLCIEAAPRGEERRLNKGGILSVGIDRLEIRLSAEYYVALFLQLGQPFKARGLLRLVHHWPYRYFGVPGIADLHGGQACRDGISEGSELPARNQHT